ncbi:EAL domain-containing protein [Nostoc sp. FACHB-145]|uniref:sensor domain-containing protein n=1 Tax=Nostoc sp. FACHB-145 TaxID=2692836 RepID=UPI001689CA67|nr:EAL domain-containing protein [Nostoc sp. FACHB-145]MBD2467360.1 EAL domain-containing protein [Nostoc sp. FACHB-145]
MTFEDSVASIVNKLVLSEEAFFFERSLDLLSVVGLDGYFKRINPMFTQILGYSQAELLASPFLDFVHPDDHSISLAELEKVKAGAPTLNFENRYRTKDGYYRWLAWTASPQLDRGVMYCVARDITEQKQTQAALKRANEELEQRVAERTAQLQESQAELQQQLIEIESIYQSAPIGLNVLDTDLRFVRINERLAQINGLSVEEHIGRTIRELLPNIADIAEDLLRPIFETGEPVLNIEIRGETPAQPGVERIWLESFLPLKDGERVIGINTVCEEITERKKAEETLRRSEERYRTLFETMEDGFCVIEMLFDENNKPIDYRFLETNPAFERQTGLLQAEGNTARQLIPYLEEFWYETYGRVALTGEPVRFENGSDAMNRWFDVYAFPIEEPERRKVAILFKDISDRKQSEKALRDNEDRLQMAITSAQLGTWDWNLVTGELKWDTACKAMFGLPPDAYISSEIFFAGLHPDDRDRLQGIVQYTFNPASGGFYDTEYRTIGLQDQVERWVRAKGQVYYDANGRPLRFIGTVLNITQQKQAEAQLIHDVSHDSLTGLPNRALFVERLERSLELTKLNSGYKFAVLFLDVDRFKVINDSLGHLIGDQLLIAVGRRLERCLRVGDIVARLGGDEFTILLEDIKDLNDVILVATRINTALTKTFNLGGKEVYTTVSIGIALSTSTYNHPEQLIRDADIAMYRAKASGKARYAIFDESMYTQAAQLLQLEMDLRRAIERQEFQVYYQPIVSLETYHITGFEALLRWQHPELGFVSPERFIPLAEETGMIVPIGYWVLREACHQMRTWQLRHPTHLPLTISVNIFSKQFSHPHLIEQIHQILQETGLEGSSLKLEITETVLMENSESATAMLLQLRQMDIQLHIDDFGIGYSSLSYLHRFPSSALKIDRSFISKIGANGENLEIVQAIISLAQSLKIDVIAEGLETKEQLRHLQNQQCQLAQGYIFSQPLDSTSVDKLIASNLHFSSS